LSSRLTAVGESQATPIRTPTSLRPPAERSARSEPFFLAAREGDFDALVALLDPEVVLRSDAGARRPAAYKFPDPNLIEDTDWPKGRVTAAPKPGGALWRARFCPMPRRGLISIEPSCREDRALIP
jgi:hypothetical protein